MTGKKITFSLYTRGTHKTVSGNVIGEYISKATGNVVLQVWITTEGLESRTTVCAEDVTVVA